ncbi:MAG: shikimate kinase [Candidatus Poribacteria bacterium]
MKVDRNISNIVLVGFMGTGKTSVGLRLAEMLNMTFVDTDDLIEKDSGMAISDIFKNMGEEHFRNLESKVAESVSGKENQVIATGGGIVKREKNIQNLKRKGLLFCLDARPEVILQRTTGYNHRPLLQVDNPIEKIKEMLKEREPFYSKADYRIDTSDQTIDQIVENIVRIYRNFVS